MSVLLSVLILAAPQDGRPIGDPGNWLSTKDYPTSEVSRGISGATGFALIVNKDGGVDDCRIEESSGSDALDATACALLKVRARFTPARDSKGQKVPFVYRSRVRWQFPQDVSFTIPVEPEVFSVAVDQNEKGIVDDCVVLTKPKGTSETAPTPCLQFPAGRQLRKMTGPDGKPAKVRMTITQSVSFAQR